jgi:polysaccharide biosynthesis transport protein
MNNESLVKTQHWTQVPALTPEITYRSDRSTEPQAGSVLDYWRILCRRKASLLLFGALGLAGGLAVTLPQVPLYRASTALEIQDSKGNASAMKILNPSSDSAPADSLTDVQTQMQILQSRTLIENALKKVQLSTQEESGPHTAHSSSLFSFLPDFGNGESLVERTKKHLKVSQSGETRIVDVSFDATDPFLAARFTNALTAELIDENLQARLEMNRRTSQWLVAQLDELRGKLKHSEDALQAYARAKGLIYTGDKQSVSEAKLRELQTELSRAEADRVEKQSRSELARNAIAETLPEVLNDSNLRTMESTLTDLRRQEADLAVTFKPDYAKAKRVRAEIESLEKAIKAQRAVIVNRIDNELQASKRREEILTAAYAKQAKSVVDDSEKSIQYDMLKHDVDTNQQIYQAMLLRVKEASITSALKATNVRVIDPAKPPAHPYKPNLPLNTGAGLLCGLIVGTVIVLVRTRTNMSVQEPGEAAMLLGIPELGVIPASKKEQKQLTPIQTLFSRQKQIGAPGGEANAFSLTSPVLADSFRSVLASILFAGAKQRQRVLVITSASPGEGKTTTATNLAVTLANMNRKVLLIDGDIRSPRLHNIFGLNNSTGLTNALQQIAISETSKVDPMIHRTSIPNLHILTSGPAVQSGADLLFSAAMPALIARYREEYGMVLIDTPPMLLMPDARALGRVADAVVLIARSGQTSRDAIQAAYRRFVEDHTPVLGVVLNDWNAKTSAYHYYATYSDTTAECAEVV